MLHTYLERKSMLHIINYTEIIAEIAADITNYMLNV